MSKPKIKPGPVLLVGDVMKDIIVLPDGKIRRGSDRAASIRTRAGGQAGNQAVWLASLGVPVILVARVGASDREALTARFENLGVKAFLAADEDRETGILVSLVDRDGERSFFTDRGANEALCRADVPEKALEQVALVLLSGYSFFAPKPRRVARELMAWAKKNNVPVALDPASSGFLSDVGVDNFLAWTKGAAMLFPNQDEARLLSGESEVRAQLAKLGRYYGLVVLKQGAEGASSINEDGAVVSLRAPRVEVVDTTGAGDAFLAGFVGACLAGNDIKTSLSRGIETGSEAVGRVGGGTG